VFEPALAGAGLRLTGDLPGDRGSTILVFERTHVPDVAGGSDGWVGAVRRYFTPPSGESA
jgi:hypothetical protein